MLECFSLGILLITEPRNLAEFMFIWVFPPNNASLSSTQVTPIAHPILNGKPQITMLQDLHSWGQCLNLFNSKDGHSHRQPSLGHWQGGGAYMNLSAIFAQNQIFSKSFSLNWSKMLKSGDDQGYFLRQLGSTCGLAETNGPGSEIMHYGDQDFSTEPILSSATSHHLTPYLMSAGMVYLQLHLRGTGSLIMTYQFRHHL